MSDTPSSQEKQIRVINLQRERIRKSIIENANTEEDETVQFLLKRLSCGR